MGDASVCNLRTSLAFYSGQEGLSQANSENKSEKVPSKSGVKNDARKRAQK